MASRDPRADIVDKDPFPQPKIRRIHSSESSSGSSMFTIEDLQNMFAGKQATPQPTGNKKIWEFSDIEKQHLGLATAAFTLALGFIAVRGLSGISTLGMNTWLVTLLLAMPVMLFAVGPAFILHEIGHKIVAKKYGCWAEFRASPGGLRFGIILAAITGWIFMAPGAVMVYGNTTKSQFGKVALAGPISNIILWIIGIILILLGLETSGTLTVQYAGNDKGMLWWWCVSNAGLALFNMIPLGPLDGRKIKHWSDFVFYFWFIICFSLVWFNATSLSNLIG